MSATSQKAKAATRFVLAPQLLGAAALTAFREEAEALAEDHVEGFNCDPSVMMSNVRIGVASVLPEMARLLTARPLTEVSWITTLINLGHAVEYAAANSVTVPTVSRAELDAKYAALQRYREPALHFARGLSCELFAKFSADEVANIEAGKGYYDHGQDGVSLASLFRRHEADIAGLHPFTPTHLTEMERLGAWVSENVTPEGARPKQRATAGVSPALRDRMWTLLKRRHAELRKAGIELFGEDGVDAMVPRLNSRVQSASAQNDDGEKPPTPPAPPVG